MKKNLIAALLLGATLLPTLQGCFPLVATGATVGVLAAVDRRSVGTQTEDESIEWIEKVFKISPLAPEAGTTKNVV